MPCYDHILKGGGERKNNCLPPRNQADSTHSSLFMQTIFTPLFSQKITDYKGIKIAQPLPTDSQSEKT